MRNLMGLSALPFAAALFATPAEAVASTMLEFSSLPDNAVRWESSPDGSATISRWLIGYVDFSIYQFSTDGAPAYEGLKNKVARIDINLVKNAVDTYYSGTFKFTYEGSRRTYPEFYLDYGANLLSGTITNGVLDSGGLKAYQDLGPFDMELQSDFIYDFSSANLGGFTQLSFEFPSPTETDSGWYSPVTGRLVSGVPEPSTWALLITGFGLAGAMLRRRQAYVLET